MSATTTQLPEQQGPKIADDDFSDNNWFFWMIGVVESATAEKQESDVPAPNDGAELARQSRVAAQSADARDARDAVARVERTATTEISEKKQQAIEKLQADAARVQTASDTELADKEEELGKENTTALKGLDDNAKLLKSATKLKARQKAIDDCLLKDKEAQGTINAAHLEAAQALNAIAKQRADGVLRVDEALLGKIYEADAKVVAAQAAAELEAIAVIDAARLEVARIHDQLDQKADRDKASIEDDRAVRRQKLDALAADPTLSEDQRATIEQTRSNVDSTAARLIADVGAAVSQQKEDAEQLITAAEGAAVLEHDRKIEAASQAHQDALQAAKDEMNEAMNRLADQADKDRSAAEKVEGDKKSAASRKAADEKSEIEKDVPSAIPLEIRIGVNALLGQVPALATNFKSAAGTYGSPEDIHALPTFAEKEAAAAPVLIALKAVKDAREDARVQDSKLKEYTAELKKRTPATPADEQARKDALQETKELGAGIDVAFRKLSAAIPGPFYDLTDPSREKVLDRTLGVLADPASRVDENNGDLRTECRDAANQFKGTIEKYLTRSSDRTDVFFDSKSLSVPIPQNEQAAAIKALDKVAETGRAVLYSTDDYGKLKTFMAASGLQEQWWPPELVDSVQAWRKTQRALNDEAAVALTEAKDKLAPFKKALELGTGGSDEAEAASNAIGVKTAIMQMVESKDAFDKDPLAQKLGAAQAWLGTFNAIPALVDLFKSGKDIKSGVKDLIDRGASPDKILKVVSDGITILDDLATLGSASMGVAALFSASGPLGTAIPYLGFVNSITSLATSILKFQEDAAIAKRAEGAERQAKASLGREGNSGLATFNAMKNERAARSQQLKKDAVDIAVDVNSVTANAATAFGGPKGAVAGAALQVVGSAVKLGSKIVFSGINWGAAQRAQETIKQAAAGNMVAQNEVFADSGFYAKMYICVLARDDVPAAKKFIVDRRIEEGDLDNVMGMKILRENLLASADQIDDTAVSSSFLEHLTGIKGKIIVDPSAAAASFLLDLATKATTKPYDPDWSTANPTEISGQAWTAAKQDAVKAGLISDSENIAALLTKASKELTTNAALMSATTPPPPDAKENLLGTVDAIRDAVEALYVYRPETFVDRKRAEHAGMATFTAGMAALCHAKVQEVWIALQTKGLYVKDWTPAQTFNTAADLTEARWKALWDEGMNQACLPEGYGGAEQLFQNLAAALTAITAARGATPVNQKTLRKAVIAGRAAYAALNKQLKDVVLKLPEVGQQSKLVGVITQLMLTSNEQQRDLDAVLAGHSQQASEQWKDPSGLTSTLEAVQTNWSTVWDYACKDGFCDEGAGDAGLGDALGKLVTAAAEINGKAIDSQKRLQAYHNVDVLAGEVRLAANKFMQLQREAATDLTTYATKVVGDARDLAQAAKGSTTLPTIALPSPMAELPKETAWTEFYEKAVTTNVVMESASNNKALKEALHACGRFREKFSAANNNEKKREAADNLVGALQEVQQAAAIVSSYKGYGTAEHMGEYLRKIGQLAKDQLESTELQTAVTGMTGFTVKAPSISDTAQWQESKRNAVTAGAIPDKKTGVDGGIEAYKKAVRNIADPGKATKKQRDAAAGALEQLIAALTRSKSTSKNTTWTTYIDGLIGLGRTEQARWGLDKVVFEAVTGVELKSEDWQRYKKIAVDRGITPDSSTGVDAAMKRLRRLPAGSSDIPVAKAELVDVLKGVKKTLPVPNWDAYLTALIGKANTWPV